MTEIHHFLQRALTISSLISSILGWRLLLGYVDTLKKLIWKSSAWNCSCNLFFGKKNLVSDSFVKIHPQRFWTNMWLGQSSLWFLSKQLQLDSFNIRKQGTHLNITLTIYFKVYLVKCKTHTNEPVAPFARTILPLILFQEVKED